MLSDLDLKDIVSGDVRATAADAQNMAKELLEARAGCGCAEAVERTGTRLLEIESAAVDIWPLVDAVRAIVEEHYPDGTKHNDPEYERRRGATAALVRQALALRDVIAPEPKAEER